MEIDVTEQSKGVTGRWIPDVKLEGFLADHSSTEQVVEIRVEPSIVYAEVVGRDSYFNFDFAIAGLTGMTLDLVFLKVAATDARGALMAYRYLNRNAAGPFGIETLGHTTIEGRKIVIGYFQSLPCVPDRDRSHLPPVHVHCSRCGDRRGFLFRQCASTPTAIPSAGVAEPPGQGVGDGG